MAALTIYPASLDGLAETFVTPTATTGDTIAEDGKQETFLEVDNGSGGSINVTVKARKTSLVVSQIGTVTVADKVVAVGDGTRKIIGPFPDAFRDSAGLVTAICSSISSVTVRAVRVSKID